MGKLSSFDKDSLVIPIITENTLSADEVTIGRLLSFDEDIFTIIGVSHPGCPARLYGHFLNKFPLRNSKTG